MDKFNRKIKKKSYTLNLPMDLVNRIQCIKRLRKGKTDIGKSLTPVIEAQIKKLESILKIDEDCWKEIKKCPSCDSYLLKRTGKNGFFLGCYNFPTCKHTEQFKK